MKTIRNVGTVKTTPTAVPLFITAYANVVAPINPSTNINYFLACEDILCFWLSWLGFAGKQVLSGLKMSTFKDTL